MAFLPYIENNSILIFVAIILRAGQGFFRMYVVVPSTIIFVILYPKERVRYVGYKEWAINIGWALGPVLGLVMYSFVGYVWTFVLIGTWNLIFIPLMIILAPEGIDSNDDEGAERSEERIIENEGNQKISIFALAKDRLIVWSWIAQILVSLAYSYFEPALSFRIAQFTDSYAIQGVVFGSFAAGFAANSIIAPYFTKYMDPLKTIALGLLSWGLSNFLVGPNSFLPQHLILIAIGLFLSGCTMIVVIINSLPVMLERSDLIFPLNKREASDHWSSMYSMCYCIGMFVGPIYCGYIKNSFGYQTSCDIMAISLIAYSIIFYFLCIYNHESSPKFKPVISNLPNVENEEQELVQKIL